MILLGIHGKARSGKDTAAKYLFERHEFTRIAFADPLKLAAQNIFGLTRQETWDDDYKEVEVPLWGMSPRKMFQLLGTEAVRGTFGQDVWIKRWHIGYNMLKETDHIVVPDVRSDLEAQHIIDNGGYILHLLREEAGLTGEAGKHSSESGLTIQPHFTITNNGTIPTLHTLLDALMETLNAGA